MSSEKKDGDPYFAVLRMADQVKSELGQSKVGPKKYLEIVAACRKILLGGTDPTVALKFHDILGDE